MTIAVTHPWSNSSSTAISSIATSTASPVSGTDWVGMGIATDQALSTVTDNLSNVYTVLSLGSITGLNLYFAYFLFATPLNGTTNVKVTATLASSGAASQSPLAASGIASSSAFDNSNSATATSASIDSGSITTVQANELLIGWMGVVSGATTSFTAGTTGGGAVTWTSQGTNTSGATGHIPSNLMYAIVSSTGTYDATATCSPSSNWLCGVMGFADTPITPPPPPGGGSQGMSVQYSPGGTPTISHFARPNRRRRSVFYGLGLRDRAA